MPSSMLIFFLIVVGIPVLSGTGAKMFRRWTDLRERELARMETQATGLAAAHAAQINKLEARVRVLERIAVDKGQDLAAEIEDLRGSSERI